jgi:HSP20 family molecular chaperone IbpA
MHAQFPIRVAIGPLGMNGHAVAAVVHPAEAKPQPQAASPPPAAYQQPAQTPLIDIYEGPDGLVLEADLPGVLQDDVTVQLEDNVLTLTAKVSHNVAEGSRLLHEEFRNGDFVRSFILSDEVDRERITADLKNGVLRLNLPKADRAKTRRIEIKSS